MLLQNNGDVVLSWIDAQYFEVPDSILVLDDFDELLVQNIFLTALFLAVFELDADANIGAVFQKRITFLFVVQVVLIHESVIKSLPTAEIAVTRSHKIKLSPTY